MPKVVDHDKYRQGLLQRSFEYFARSGYAAVTMRDLAKHLGVSTGTLYHYFPSKEELFEALIDYLVATDLGLAATLPPASSSLNDRVFALFAVLEEHKEHFLMEMCLWMDFYRHLGREPVGCGDNQVVKRAFEKNRAWIMSYLEIDDPDLVTMMSCFLNGVIVELMGPREHISFSKLAERLIELLTDCKA